MITLLLFCASHLPLAGQLPATALYLLEVAEPSAGELRIHSPKYLSNFNNNGYTNQPCFINDDILFVSVGKTDTGQVDIYGINIKNGTLRQITRTPENEFSPQLTPNRETFSCVRQEAGDEPDQQLFRYPLELNNNGQAVIADVTDIGYYCWINPDKVALFIVDDPPSLALLDLKTGQKRLTTSKIGRCLRMTPDGRLAYVHKFSDEYWYLKTMNTESTLSEIVTQMPAGSEDFAIDSKGRYFTGSGSVLLFYDPSSMSEWKQVADLGPFGIQTITRMALNGRNQLALVSVASGE